MTPRSPSRGAGLKTPSSASANLAEGTNTDLDRLEREVAHWKDLATRLGQELREQATWARQQLMRDATRRYNRGQMTSTWVVATCHLADSSDLLHHRNPAIAPRIIEPAPGRGRRYLNGDIRDAGPGSHIGVAHCGLPLMADELWVRADTLLRAGWVTLCGMCSYLVGQPTPEAAWEATRDVARH